MLKENKLFLDQDDELYELLIPKDHILRQISELVDFTFIYDELKSKYCLDNGRNAINPIILFKYIILKNIYNLSDVDVVNRTLHDLSFKYFLQLDPKETKLINPSTLTKFRRQRLKDENLLDILISKSIQIAQDNGLKVGKKLIVDSTHTSSIYNLKSPHQALLQMAKDIRKVIYQVDSELKDQLPKKAIESDNLETIIEYCKKLTKFISENEKLKALPAITEPTNLLNEIVEDDNFEKLELSKENEASLGHKSRDTKFYGYKNHLGINEDGLVVAAIVTTGEKHDGKQLPTLIEKAEENGMKVDVVIGDGAYSEQDNLKLANDKDIELVSNLSQTVVHGNGSNKGFEYNKDAEMYVCPQGHLAIRKSITKVTKRNDTEYGKTTTYFFDIEKCKHCKSSEGCYKPNSKSKSYSVTEKLDVFKEQLDFMKTEKFSTEMSARYKVEQLNAHLKKDLGLGKTKGLGLLGMNIQSATTIFISNIQKIIKKR